MKKTLKLIMAIVLFIAVIAIASGVKADTVNLNESNATVKADGSVKTYTLNESANNKDIIVGAQYSNIILDLNNFKKLGKITVYATNVDIINGNATNLEVKSGASVVLDEEHGKGFFPTVGIVNYGTIEIGKGRSMDKVENNGTLVVKEGATVSNLTMRAGTVTVEGTVTKLVKMEAGKIEVGDKATFEVNNNVVEGGVIISAKQLNQNYIKNKEEYAYCRHDDEKGKTLSYYIVPRADLQVAVKFMDVETGEYVTNLKAEKVYEVEAQVVYNGEEVLKDAWNTVKFTSKNTDVLMAVTDTDKQFKALEDGEATLEVLFAEGTEEAEVKREVSVTVGEVKNDEPENEPEGNQPSENKGELDSTPKTGDYCRHGSSNISSR